MSAGHHRNRSKISPEELDRLLSLAPVRRALAQPYKVDIRHDVPYVGSSSIDRRTVYLDRHLHSAGQRHGMVWIGAKLTNVRPSIVRHERIEPVIENELGWPYPRAHLVATALEERMVDDPAAYERALRPFIKADEHESLVKVPTDLDIRPVLAAPVDKTLLNRIIKAQDAQKKPGPSVGYVKKSTHVRQRCGICTMFIPPEYGGVRCTAVYDDIVDGGYCRLFEAAGKRQAA